MGWRAKHDDLGGLLAANTRRATRCAPPSASACSLKPLVIEVAGIELVDTDVAVLAAGHEAPAVAEPGERVHGPEVALDCADLLLVNHVPQQRLKLPGAARSGGHVLGVLTAAHEDVELGVRLRRVKRRDGYVVQWAVGL